MRALREFGVLSPLRICGLTKAEIRRRSRELDLPTWDKPAYACLATRIPTGEVIDGDKLRRVEGAETALREMGLGYRAPYLARCAERFAREKERQKRLDREGKEAACGYLRSFPGIGPKVAECIALFGLGYTGAFPRDTWIKRIEEAHYGGRFPDEKYPGTAGVMQQYLFFYARLRETERANAPG